MSMEGLEHRLDEAIGRGALPNLHGLVVVRAGEVVVERYGAGDDFRWGYPLGRVTFDAETLHDLRSATKSIVGLLYGIALDRGAVPDPEASLLGSFPEYPDLADDPARRDLRIEHALTMTMATDWDESLPYTDPANSEIAMERAADRYRFILDRPVTGRPGARRNYSGGATALLGRLIARGTGRSLSDFALDALFTPLGITTFDWITGADGTPSAASGLRLSPRDLARVGQLVLHGGTWEGRSIVPSTWLDRSLRQHVPIDDTRAYGYHWYVDPSPEGTGGRGWVGAMGNGGQRLWVFPSVDLAVAATFGNYDRPDQGEAPARLFDEVVDALT
jgi:CubicO group peptidase (beta-lactamase class C family)